MKKITTIAFAAVLLLVTACTDHPDNIQQQSQNTTEAYQAAAQAAVPYPLAEMKKGGWLERRLLVENLKRQNNKNRLAYVTLLNLQGQPIVTFPIQGMVFSLDSQLTTEDSVRNYSRTGTDRYVTKAPGDNGTWGPEPNAIGFFTTEGVEVKWNGLYLESDSPLDIPTKPLITYDASTAKPSVTGGGVKPVG